MTCQTETFRPKPLGMWERWHIANDSRWTQRYRPNSFSVMLSNRQLPRITHAQKMDRRYLYTEAAVDEFFRALAEQHASRPRARTGENPIL